MRLAVLHTTTLTVAPLARLAQEVIPGIEVINFVDDAVLPQLATNGGNVGAVAPRLVQYGRFARDCGADVILSACSSVGELAGEIQQAAAIPVVRIDEAMAENAVRLGMRIGVAATVATTLHPTVALLRRKAEDCGRSVDFEPLVVETAFARLREGDEEGHDKLLAEALEAMAGRNDAVVLAQASMARVLDRVPEAARGKFLTSPRPAMERVRDVLAGSNVRS